MLKPILITILYTFFFSIPAFSGQRVIASGVDNPPRIDGKGDDSAWQASPKITARDAVARVPVEFQAVYTATSLYMKVRVPDPKENRKHKVLEWNSALNTYRTGNLREDSFVLKWSMEAAPVDLRLHSETAYRADIWFWKAFRTDPMGYADDKIHRYNSQPFKKSHKLVLDNGNIWYLTRSSDWGKSSYESIAYEKFSGHSAVRYKHRSPTGSRADVRAKGRWSGGHWTIEFERRLNTGHSDDIQFDVNRTYLFGFSKFEIAGKPVNPKLEQPHYESGDVGEILVLVFD